MKYSFNKLDLIILIDSLIFFQAIQRKILRNDL